MNPITTTNPYLNMSIDDLVEGIKKANAKARSKGQEMKSQMERAGHMLIELKRHLPHGSFMIDAARFTGLAQRNINRYMEMARGVIPHRTVGIKERETRKDRMINLIRATELLEDDGTPPKVDTVSTLPAPAPEKPARSSWVSQTEVIEAEVIEPESEKAKRYTFKPEDGKQLYTQCRIKLDRILDQDVHFQWAMAEVMEYCAKRIDKRDRMLSTIMAMIPKLSTKERNTLLKTLNTRWT